VNISLRTTFEEQRGVWPSWAVERVQDVLKIAAAWTSAQSRLGFAGAAGRGVAWEWMNPRREVAGMAHRRAKGDLSGRTGPAFATRQDEPGMEGRPAHGGDRRHRRFGGTWSGAISQAAPTRRWHRQMEFSVATRTVRCHRLDLWIGRARGPDGCSAFCRRFLGGAARRPHNAQCPRQRTVRRVDAEGELQIDEFTLEKTKFEQVRPWARCTTFIWSGVKPTRSGPVARSAPVMMQDFSLACLDVSAELDHVGVCTIARSTSRGRSFGGTARNVAFHHRVSP